MFDLDPGARRRLARRDRGGARGLRERLDALGLESFVKTSGGKGLHVVAPIAGADGTPTKEFTAAIALQMAADAPDEISRQDDQERARRAASSSTICATAAAPPRSSPIRSRARPGAPVSTPIDWRELTPKMSPDRFTVLNIRDRLKRLRADPWADMGKVRQTLPSLEQVKKRG